MLIDDIPIGRKNAVRRKTLSMRLNLTDSELRKEIKKLRQEYVILNLQDGNRYFRPSEEDTEYVKKFKEQEEKRAKSIFWTLKPVREFLKE